MKKDEKIIVQIYEVQNPQEAEELIQIGVDHIGSVIVSETDWKVSGVRDTMDLVSSSSAKSCLIPLFNSPDSVWRTLDYYQPDIVNFCEAFPGRRAAGTQPLSWLQKAISQLYWPVAFHLTMWPRD